MILLAQVRIAFQHLSLKVGTINLRVLVDLLGPHGESFKTASVSIPRLSAPSCQLLGKINTIGAFFSTRQLCLQSKWPTILEIIDVSQRRMFPQCLFCPVDGRMVLRVQAQRPLAVLVAATSKTVRLFRHQKLFFY